MVKKFKYLAMVLLVGTNLSAGADIYEKNCLPCHQELPTSLGEMFKKYLLIYSSEKFVKAGIKHYLRNPSETISVMGDLFINTYGIKRPTTLSDEELEQALDTYWEKYKVFGKLK